MKTDGQIKQDILDELVFLPDIDETQIGVIVEDGVVTLTGFVDAYPKKVAAEQAVPESPRRHGRPRRLRRSGTLRHRVRADRVGASGHHRR